MRRASRGAWAWHRGALQRSAWHRGGACVSREQEGEEGRKEKGKEKGKKKRREWEKEEKGEKEKVMPAGFAVLVVS